MHKQQYSFNLEGYLRNFAPGSFLTTKFRVMLLKWALVIGLGYFIYKKFIAIPPQDNNNSNLKNADKSKITQEDEDYIDYEEVD